MSPPHFAQWFEIGVMISDPALTETTKKTANDLRTIARSQLVRELTPLSLPEIDAVVDLVARMLPAGNVPGVILNGLARLPGRRLPLHTVKRDINLLFKGVEQALDKALYAAFFAGPAAVIWGYQNLLKLAGKDPDDAFPEGTWQFYVDYALRDDTARHANETHGFDTILTQHRIQLSAVDRATAWIMAAIHTLHQYPAWLENEWRERVHTYTLFELMANTPHADRLARLYRTWEAQRPYRRGVDAAPTENYARYRRTKFDRFMAEALRDVPTEVRKQWHERVRAAEAKDLAAYQQQMSILAYLEPGAYGEVRRPIDLAQSHVGAIIQGRYYLIPICAPGKLQPIDIAAVRSAVAAIWRTPASTPTSSLMDFASIKRKAQANLRSKLDAARSGELDQLRTAPILINCDRRPAALTLPEVRQTERGIGDHALTIFDTGHTFVFDQSHIFFDGAWGAALAEIMTNEALAWAVYLNSLKAEPQPGSRPRVLAFDWQPAELEAIQQAPRVMPEVSAETDAIHLKAIVALRQLFKRRSDLLTLTVNDLLVLYRAIHMATYEADPDLVTDLKALLRETDTKPAGLAALEAVKPEQQTNPVILIPVDASRRSPRERLYPMTFDVPLKELDLLKLHTCTLAALHACEKAAPQQRAMAWREFDQLQHIYLATLAGFGAVSSRAKEIALTGESASVGTIRLLAHMPQALQTLLDRIPGRFDVLNDLIKGREVFSNVGAVANNSTLTRFVTAKDDNEKKTLAWGVLTDAQGVLRLTLRDFRPHVEPLVAIGRRDLAQRMAQDYVDAYARGLNHYVRGLQHITLASYSPAETR